MKFFRDQYFLIVLFSGLLVYTSNIWGTSVYILDEAKNASCAMEMLQRRDWVVPTFNGELRTDKPPFHYWLMMLAYWLGGVEPFTARIFQSLAGVVLAGLSYLFVKKQSDDRTALVSALVLVSSFQLHVQFHLAVPDPFLILWLTVTLLSFFAFQQGNQKAWKWIFIGSALGFLSKGPIAIVLPALAALVYLVISRNALWPVIRKLRLLQGIALFFLITLPWYVWVGVNTNGEWLNGFFMQHNIGRFTSTMEGHRGYFFVPPLVLLFSLFPFSLFIVPAVKSAWSDKGLPLFALAAAAVIMLFFMFSKSFLPGYISPAIPFLAIVLGNFFQRHFKWSRKWLWVIPVSFLISLAIPAGLWYATHHQPELRVISGYLTFAFVLPLLTGAGCYFFLKKNLKMSFISIVAAWVFFSLTFFYVLFPAVDRLNPVQTSRAIRIDYADYRPVAFGLFNPAFVFEYRKVIPRFTQVIDMAGYLEKNPESLIFTRASALEELQKAGEFKELFRQRDLFESSETIILVPVQAAVHR